MGNLDHGAAAINFVKQRTEGLTHIQEIEINDNQSHFKVTLGIQTINTNVEKHCHAF